MPPCKYLILRSEVLSSTKRKMSALPMSSNLTGSIRLSSYSDGSSKRLWKTGSVRVPRLALTHPFAKCAKGWATRPIKRHNSILNSWWRGGGEADSSAALRNDKQEKQWQRPIQGSFTSFRMTSDEEDSSALVRLWRLVGGGRIGGCRRAGNRGSPGGCRCGGWRRTRWFCPCRSRRGWGGCGRRRTWSRAWL